MKRKFIFCLVSLCCLLSVTAVDVTANVLVGVQKLALSSNGVPFEIPKGPGKGSRSVLPAIPIFASIVDNNLLEIDFLEAISDEVEITVSQDGTPISSSSENILSPETKVIQLPQGLSGNFLLEIRGANGAYAYAWFTL